MTSTNSPTLRHWPNLVSRAAGLIVAFAGAVVLVGWAFGLAVFERLEPGWTKMAPLTAISLLVAGLSLSFLAFNSTGDRDHAPSYAFVNRSLVPILAAMIVMIALVRLSTNLFQVDLGIDLLWFHDSNGKLIGSPPARMALATAFGFLLIGWALLLINSQRYFAFFQTLTLCVGLVGWQGFSHYLYGGEPLLLYADMAFHTALSFLILCVGILCLRTDRGLMALLIDDSAGGMIARRLVPAALFLPMILGWLRLEGQRAGLFGTEAGISIFALSNMIVFGGLIWRSARLLRRTDRERNKAQSSLNDSRVRLASALESGGIGTWTYDVATNESWLDDALTRIFGRTRDDLEGGRPEVFFSYVHPEDASAAEAAFQESIRTTGLYRTEFRYIKPDGEIIWLTVRGSLERDQNGSPLRMMGACVDITERKRAEEERFELEQQLRQSQKLEAIGQLAGGVAHDFNNLLTVINGYSDLILRKIPDSDPNRSKLEEIAKAGSRATSLTRQLLAFSRKQVLQPKTFNLNTVVPGMEKMLRRVIGEDIELRTALETDLGNVHTDPGQIEQVIMNLVVNARDAMPTGGKLTIETGNAILDETYARHQAEVRPGRYVMLAVSDTGTGMNEETRARIFEPFFTTKEKGKGTGLGLAMVYGIVKQSDGNVWVYSEPGKGTTFKIYLPRVDERVEVDESRPVVELPRATETILLAEDEEMVRNLAREILEANGFRVLVAESGNEALRISEEHNEPIDLLLTDVVMPQMSGKELVEQLAAKRPAMSVLYMSGYTDETIVHHGVLDEGVNFIEKPFSPDALGRKVRAILNDSQEDQ